MFSFNLENSVLHALPDTHVWVFDDFFDAKFLLALNNFDPHPSDLRYANTMYERKYTMINFDSSYSLVEDILYAFQNPEFINTFSSFTEIPGLSADPSLYAGGVSVMTKGCFLSPHIDNSHDKTRSLYRRLNLLYYYSSETWQDSFGGCLNLYDPVSYCPLLSIAPVSNRLVVMETNPGSWHSVSPITDPS